MLNLNQLKGLYTNSPLWLKNIYASIPYDIRNGHAYRKWKNFLAEQINDEEYQLIKLKETISYAYSNTAYYKKLFHTLGCTVNDINDLQDIQKLPFIDKDTVRDNYDDLIAKNLPNKRTFFVTTGGTSGEPMKFLQSNNVWSKELAFLYSMFSRHGYYPKMLKASFRGGEFDNNLKEIYWKQNPVHNEIHFSPFHINLETISFYVDKLNALKPLVFHSYPSSLLLLIDCMAERGLALEYIPKLIIIISENYTSNDILKIKNFFDCELLSFYGHSERLILAPTITQGMDIHKIDKRYGLFELIDNNGVAITADSNHGEMIGTSFDNLAMPLIRYKTNDYTHFVNYHKCEIGKIEGRWNQEYLDGKNGSKIYLTALNMHSNIFDNVIQFQFIQNSVGEVDFLVLVKPAFGESDEKKILDAFKKKVGHSINFKLICVAQLMLTTRGKFKRIIRT